MMRMVAVVSFLKIDGAMSLGLVDTRSLCETNRRIDQILQNARLSTSHLTRTHLCSFHLGCDLCSLESSDCHEMGCCCVLFVKNICRWVEV